MIIINANPEPNAGVSVYGTPGEHPVVDGVRATSLVAVAPPGAIITAGRIGPHAKWDRRGHIVEIGDLSKTSAEELRTMAERLSQLPALRERLGDVSDLTAAQLRKRIKAILPEE